MNYCGLDVAMKSSYLYITDRTGHKRRSGEIPTTAEALRQRLRPYLRGGLRVALEAGNQSAWLHDLLVELGAEVTVVNPTKLKLIAESRRKRHMPETLCEFASASGWPPASTSLEIPFVPGP